MTTDKGFMADEPFTIVGEIEGEILSGMEGNGSGGFVNRLKQGKEWITSKNASLKPWSSFCNVRKISCPKSAGEATQRLFTNLAAFQSNYVFICLGLAAYCIFTNPILLIALALCVAVWWFLSIKNKGENFTIAGREFSPKEIYAVLLIIVIPMLYFGALGGTVFWLIGASLVIVVTHGVLLADSDATTDDIQLEEVSVS